MEEKIIPVKLSFLVQLLSRIESDWVDMDNEWGPTKGGLKAWIKEGGDPEIYELRRLINSK